MLVTAGSKTILVVLVPVSHHDAHTVCACSLTLRCAGVWHPSVTDVLVPPPSLSLSKLCTRDFVPRGDRVVAAISNMMDLDNKVKERSISVRRAPWCNQG